MPATALRAAARSAVALGLLSLVAYPEHGATVETVHDCGECFVDTCWAFAAPRPDPPLDVVRVGRSFVHLGARDVLIRLARPESCARAVGASHGTFVVHRRVSGRARENVESLFATNLHTPPPR